MELINKIHRAIFELENLNSRKENIKITTSFITRDLIENDIRDYTNHHIAKLNIHGNKMFGVEVSFNHYSNDIVIYDETKACLNKMFKIIIKI